MCSAILHSTQLQKFHQFGGIFLGGIYGANNNFPSCSAAAVPSHEAQDTAHHSRAQSSFLFSGGAPNVMRRRNMKNH